MTDPYDAAAAAAPIGNGRRYHPGAMQMAQAAEAAYRRRYEGQDTRMSSEVETVEFPQCLDAKARGYSMPFVCCSIHDGDFVDPDIWHCGRVPTMLDAVFVRHFVSLAVPGTGGHEEVRVRALWIIDSVDGDLRGRSGVLRGGKVFGGMCENPRETSTTLAPYILNGIKRNFEMFLNRRTEDDVNIDRIRLPDICAAFGVPESAFDTSARPILMRVEGIGGPVPKDIAVSVAMTSVEAEQRRRENADRQQVEAVNLPEFESLKRFTVGRGRQRREREEEEKRKRAQNEVEGEAKGFAAEGSSADEEEATEGISDYDNEDDVAQQDGDSQWERGSGARRREQNAASSVEEQAVPSFLAGGLANYLPPARRNLQQITFREPPKADGPVTMRVEKGAALLLFENVSVDAECDLRNDGTFYIGDTVLPDCVKAHPEESGLCRVPGLVSVGSVVATQPANIMWLQLAEARKHLGSEKFWYGIAQYPHDLPGNERSTLTLFGDITVKRIIPGFSLSFKRLGFPPNPPPPAAPLPTTLTVDDSEQTSDLVIYMDLFDNDGFIDCCQQFYEQHVAEFTIRNTNLKLGRYADFYKDVGDNNSKISEQIIIRAPRITAEQMFLDLPAVIPQDDAALTNRERPYKMAGINRDIVFFQCSDECHISNQIFKRQDPYASVEVKRELKKNRSTVRGA